MARVSEQDVLNVISDALNLKQENVTIDSSVNSLAEWDSLGHLSILSALDEFFDGKIGGISEIATADSVGKIVQVLKDNSLL